MEEAHKEEGEEEESGKMRLMLRVGKKVVITGVVISSAPFVVPPLLVLSTLGFAFAVPFGFVFASYACTDKLMSTLLSRPRFPLPLPLSRQDMEREEQEFVQDTKGKIQKRIELVGDGKGLDCGMQGKIGDQDDDYMVEKEKPAEGKDASLTEMNEQRHKDVEKNVDWDFEVQENLINEKGMVDEDTIDVQDVEEKIPIQKTFLADEEVEEMAKEKMPMKETLVVTSEDDEEPVMNKINGVIQDAHGRTLVEEEEILIKNISQSVDQEDDLVMDIEGLIQENRDEPSMSFTIEAEEIPDEETSLSTEEEKWPQPLVSEVEEMGLKALGDENDGKVVQVEAMPFDTTEEEKQSLLSETNGAGQQAPDEKNVGKMIQAKEMSIEGTYGSITEEEKQPLLGETKGVKYEDASQMVQVEIPVASTFGSTQEKDVALLSETEGVIVPKSREGESDGECLQGEQIPIERTEECARERGNERDIYNAEQKEKPLEYAIGVLEERRHEDNCEGVLNAQVERAVKEKGDQEIVYNYVQDNGVLIDQVEGAAEEKGEQEITDYIVEEEANEGFVRTEVTMRKKIDEKILDNMLEVEKKPITEVELVRIVSDRGNAREIADGSRLNLFDEETALSEQCIFEVDEVHEDEVLAAIDWKNLREVADESGLLLFDEETTAFEQYTFGVDEVRGDDVLPVAASCYSFPSCDFLDRFNSRPHVSSEHSHAVKEKSSYKLGRTSADSVIHPVSPGCFNSGSAEGYVIEGTITLTKEVLYKEQEEERIWGQIDAIKKIVGYKAAPQSTCTEELNALYVFTGVEPPQAFKDSSDLAELGDKLRLLMAIIGVK